jgi:hypothetical protein
MNSDFAAAYQKGLEHACKVLNDTAEDFQQVLDRQLKRPSLNPAEREEVRTLVAKITLLKGQITNIRSIPTATTVHAVWRN